MVLDRQQLKEALKGKDVKDTHSLNSLLAEVSREVIETLLDGEYTHFMGYEKYDQKSKESNNSRNGYTSKEVISNFGPFQIQTPRDRQAKFKPKIVPKRQRDICGLEDKIISLYGKGMTTRDIQAHILDIYNFEISPDFVSTVTNQVLQKANEWQNRPLEACYPIIFLDAMRVSVRTDGRVSKISVYNILGIDLEGKKDCLGIWIGEAESAKFWLTVLNDLRNRGVEEVLIFSVDNLTGLSQAIEAVYPYAEIQKCVVHQIRNSLKNVSYKNRKELTKDLKNIYCAPSEEQGAKALEEFKKKWDEKYKYIGKSWENNWHELATFFKFPEEMRRLIYTTNPIESFHRTLRKAIKTRSIFPNKESIFKALFLNVERITESWNRPIPHWTSIFPQIVILFEERIQKYLQ